MYALVIAFQTGHQQRREGNKGFTFSIFLLFLGVYPEDNFISFGYKAGKMNTFIECPVQWVE